MITIQYPERVVLAYNPVIVVLSTTTTDVENHYLHLQVKDKNNVIIAEDRLAVNRSEASFDISEYLKIQQKKLFNLFEDENTVERHENDDLLFKYRLTVFETFDNDGVEHNKFVSDKDLFVLQGGLSKCLLSQYKKFNTSFYQEFIEKHKFLTWQPDSKKMNINDTEKLYFYSTYDEEVKFVISYTTTSSINENTLAQFQIEGNAIYEITLCPKEFTFLEQSEKDNLISFDIYIVRPNSEQVQLSEKRTFHIDKTYHNNSKQFIFKNSLGLYDTIRLLGITEEKSEFEHIIYHSDKISKKLTDFNEIHTTNSGLLSLTYQKPDLALDYFNEIFLSEDVYIVDKYRIVRPILITSNSKKGLVSNKFLHSFEIEYLFDEKNTFFSFPIDENPPEDNNNTYYYPYYPYYPGQYGYDEMYFVDAYGYYYYYGYDFWGAGNLDNDYNYELDYIDIVESNQTEDTEKELNVDNSENINQTVSTVNN